MLLDVAMSRHETIFNVLRIFAHNAYMVAVSGRKPYCRPSVLEKIFLRVMLSMLRATHSKKYHKYITNIPQIYHKSTTKCDIVSQKCDIVPQKCDIVPQKA